MDDLKRADWIIRLLKYKILYLNDSEEAEAYGILQDLANEHLINFYLYNFGVGYIMWLGPILTD